MILTKHEFQRLKNNDPQVFEKVYDAFKDRIFNYILIKTNYNEVLTEDIVSETFCIAIKSISSLRKRESVQAWLLTIAFRQYNDYLRKQYKEKKYAEIIREQKKNSRQNDLFEEFYEDQRYLLITMALENLPENYKTIITKKYMDNLSLKEIAVKTGKNEIAAQSTLARAKRALKQEIEKISTHYF